MTLPWGTLAAALRYGYSVHYVLQVEGIPTLFMEVLADAIAPAGYTLDDSLVLDSAARFGGIPDERTGIAAGFDLEARLLDSEPVRTYFVGPSVQSTLRADLTAAGTNMQVDPGHGFVGPGRCWVDVECIPFTGNSWEGLTGLTRGSFGRARAWKSGTIVANAPRKWVERRVDLFAVAIDPTGRYYQGGSILANASCIFTGFVQSKPERDESEWTFSARSVDRRLAQPFAAAAQGQAVWSVNDDSPIEVDTRATILVKVTERPQFGSTITATLLQEFQVTPFAGLSSPLRPSVICAKLKAAWDTATTHAQLGELIWKDEFVEEGNAIKRRWRAYQLAQVSASGNLIWVELVYNAAWGKPFRWNRNDPTMSASARNMPTTASSGWGEVWLQMSVQHSVDGAALSVIMEEGAPADLPATGWLALEADSTDKLIKYSGRQTDENDSNRVNLQLARDLPITDFADLAAADADGTLAEVSARFLYSDAGRAQDIMRRLLVSTTGTGAGGTYDTLPPLAAYGLGTLVDTASFTSVFDGVFLTFALEVAIDFGLTFEQIFGGLLRISGRSIVARPAADGSEVRLTAINTGQPTTARYTATITDAELAASETSTKQIRPVRRSSPRTISLQTHLLQEDRARGRVTFNNTSGNEIAVGSWNLDIYGLQRSTLRAIAEWWCESIFRNAWTQQRLEIDVVPWVQADAGDVIYFDTRDPHVWSYSTARPGYSGLARVVGKQLLPKSQIQTLTIEIDGLYTLKPMSPSVAIVAVNGTATAPTSIDIAQTEYPLFASLIAGFGSLKLLAHLPGNDAGRAEYTISAVTDTGSVCRLTVSVAAASPTVTLSTSYRLTFPVEATGNATQALYLHNTSRAQWG